MLQRLMKATSSHRNISLLSRVWSGSTTGTPKYTEKQLSDSLKSRFPNANNIEVHDVSGGCGAMYEIIVESTCFKGLSRVKQHQLITDALKEQIKEMHGLRIQTSVPST